MCGPYVILLDNESESESLGKLVIMLRKTSIVSDCVKKKIILLNIHFDLQNVKSKYLDVKRHTLNNNP